MSGCWFPDNTVLCNFAAVGRLDLLEVILRGRGRWTEAVAQEARRSGRHLPPLAQNLAWLGEPLVVDDARDVRMVEGVRRAVFGGSPSKPLAHLGEAQTCYVLKHWPKLSGSSWLSDDREAIQYARRQGIATRETWEIVREAVAMADIDADAAYSLLESMADSDRGLRVPDRREFLL